MRIRLTTCLRFPNSITDPTNDLATATNEAAPSAAPPQRKGRACASATAAEGSDGPQRIAKLLARAGIASRREIERMIAEGRIALNGEKLTTPATLLDDARRA